jgi:phosphoglycolate phosphatase-like HAD superfamily hydrolase
MYMIKAVLFDFDDTLVTTIETKVAATQHLAKTYYDLVLSDELIKKHWGKPFREIMGILFAEVTDDLDTVIKNYEAIRKDFPATFHKDVPETLDVLFKRVKVGIVSATTRNLILQDLQLLNFPPENFFYIQSSDDTTVHKPNPEVFLPILQKLQTIGITKKEIIYVGDSLSDYIAASKAGLKFYGISGRTTTKEEFIKHKVEVLNSLTELLVILTYQK